MYRLPDIEKVSGLIYGISDASYGNMSLAYNANGMVPHNREAFLRDLGLKPEKCVGMALEHDDKIEVVSSKDCTNSILTTKSTVRADAIITKEVGLTLWLVVADCIPLILYDAKSRILGLVHSGIKNTSVEMPRKAVRKMVELGANAAGMLAIIGPSLKQESFNYQYFDQKDTPLWKDFVKERNGEFLIDNIGNVKAQLLSEGIPESSIHISPQDTFTDHNFFSHKRVIELKNEPERRFAMAVQMV